MHLRAPIGAVKALWRVLIAAMVGYTMLLAAPAQAQQQLANSADNNIAARLVVEQSRSDAATAALVFTPNEGWHGYWENPGDAGYGMVLKWELPPGWTAGRPQYPVPDTLIISGLMNHVYEAPYTVLVPLKRDDPEAASLSSEIAVDATWLACTDEICVPESALLTAMPSAHTISTQAGRTGSESFVKWRAAIPPKVAGSSDYAVDGRILRVSIPYPADAPLSHPHLFIREKEIVQYAAPQQFYRKGDTLIVEIPLADLVDGIANPQGQITGILALSDGSDGLPRRGVEFAANPGTVPSGGELLATANAAPDTPSLWWLIGAALLGGMLLNIMPCVFPVLSLKALSLARAGESEAEARREGMAYTAGTVLTAMALGGVLLILRAGGEQVGWAFQLQQPWVVALLLVLATALTANFLGLYSIPSLSFRSGGQPASAFSTGVLAAFVATPCTGPFMAAAMGAALLLPTFEAMLLFAALGFGLGLPFLLIGVIPALRKMLPKPGPWMETFRKIMAVPMGLTALALIWLLWRMGGAALALNAAILAIGIVIVIVMWCRRKSPDDSGAQSMRLLALAVSIALVVSGAIGIARSDSDLRLAQGENLLDAKPYSAEALAKARSTGRPVFVWFTADWCVSCKYNEGVAIEREATKEAFEEAGVIAFRGDWTRPDPEITRALNAHGAAGVPLYLWYPAGGDAEILPQVLTPDSLIERALQDKHS